MKVIENRILPLPGYVAMTLWPFIFLRKGWYLTQRTRRHETIHARQQLELLALPCLPVLFLLWYGVEWIVRSIQYRSFHQGYRNICFEREAYDNDTYVDYLDRRHPYAWLRYL